VCHEDTRVESGCVPSNVPTHTKRFLYFCVSIFFFFISVCQTIKHGLHSHITCARALSFCQATEFSKVSSVAWMRRSVDSHMAPVLGSSYHAYDAALWAALDTEIQPDECDV
jgi:hypothetical protein